MADRSTWKVTAQEPEGRRDHRREHRRTVEGQYLKFVGKRALWNMLPGRVRARIRAYGPVEFGAGLVCFWLR